MGSEATSWGPIYRCERDLQLYDSSKTNQVNNRAESGLRSNLLNPVLSDRLKNCSEIDDHKYSEQLIETGVSQGSLVLLILFIIYLNRVFQAIEAAVLEILTLFFTDDLGMLVAASSVT